MRNDNVMHCSTGRSCITEVLPITRPSERVARGYEGDELKRPIKSNVHDYCTAMHDPGVDYFVSRMARNGLCIRKADILVGIVGNPLTNVMHSLILAVLTINARGKATNPDAHLSDQSNAQVSHCCNAHAGSCK